MKENESVVTIKKYIDKNYSNFDVSMNVFTGLVGFSRVYINREYRAVYGMTPVEYLKKVRLEKAKELIELGVPIGMSANKVGYTSMRTFYRAFEQDTGMAPGKYKMRSVKTYEQFKNIVKLHDLRPLDYGRKACDAIMLDCAPAILPPISVPECKSMYSYHQGIFLLGMYRIYQMCKKKKYLNYINKWCDFITKDDGSVIKYKKHPVDAAIAALDNWQPVRIFTHMYDETKTEKYLRLIEKKMSKIFSWRSVEDGLLVSFIDSETVCINSVYMMCPSMCMCGKRNEKDLDYYDIVTNQPIMMYKKMRNPQTGLLYHAFDRDAQWADPMTGLSGDCWGRGMGYYIMGILDMLDYLPKEHKDYDTLCEIAMQTLEAIAKYQDESGRWYQLVDKGDIKENWLENSCSCMFVYSFAKAINEGIIDKEYATVAMRGYSGIIDTIEYGESGEMILKDICDGTMVGDDYFERKSTHKNDLHGTSAFVLMCTEVEKLLNSI